MADEEVKKEEVKKDEPEAKADGDAEQKPEGNAAKKGPGILTWAIIAVIIIALGGSGFVLGRLLAGSSAPAETAEQAKTAKAPKNDLTAKTPQKTWYHQLDPVVANLDVPGATRYIRAVLVLELDATLDQKKGTELFDEKKPVIINWLTIYLSGLTLEDATGASNLRRIQSNILDAFNEQLFPDSKPMIKKILLKEFPIQ
ncbi:MAG: flagellar basal body-associated FliL family protein [Planctomycetes bacterium]|nr:flagellar basal body-associated FliL family protein [Planctomycetota bacterium]